MSFSFISKLSLYLSFIFIISCQDTISSIKNNNIIDAGDYNFQLETKETLDFSIFEEYAGTHRGRDYSKIQIQGTFRFFP